jgi:hypothetical protein
MKIYNILFIALVAVVISACADLDTLAPINSVPSDQAITNAASAAASVNGIYDEVQDETLVFDGWLALPQFFSDEADATGTFPTRLEFGNLNVFPANGTMAAVFTDLYDGINVANNVITLIPGVEDEAFSAEQRADFIGQARFLRAQMYLHLVTLWGDIPLITEPTVDVGDVLNVPNSTVDQVYAQIIDDLNDAVVNVAQDVGPLGASKQAANALLARVALYQGRWADAQSLAEGVLGAGFDLTTVPFLDDQIYSLGFTPTDGNTLNFFYGPADFGGRYSIGPSATLINSYDPADLRFAATIDTMTASVPYGLKYPSFGAGISGTATDPIFFIRHAEMVMIAAEAAAEQGNFGTASDYINQVRSRAGLPGVTLDAGNFVDLILAEKFLEFAFEGPQRLIDLRRKGRAQSVLGPIGYDACDDVWPLPQRDVDRNINLTQNSCCNC